MLMVVRQQLVRFFTKHFLFLVDFIDVVKVQQGADRIGECIEKGLICLQGYGRLDL
jgi:hypothetical protein